MPEAGMTPSEAVEILNYRMHRECNRWEAMSQTVVAFNPDGRGYQHELSHFEALAIADAYLHEHNGDSIAVVGWRLEARLKVINIRIDRLTEMIMGKSERSSIDS